MKNTNEDKDRVEEGKKGGTRSKNKQEGRGI